MALSDNVIRDGDQGFIGFSSRLNPLTLPAGMLQDSVNMRLDRGVAQTRKGAKRLTDTVGTTGAPLTLDFPLASDVNITQIQPTADLATVTCASAHGYSNGNQINIRGATGVDANFYNGDFTITVTGTTTFTYTMTGAPAGDAAGTLRANRGPIVRLAYSGGLYAAGMFASQNYDDANEYLVLAGNDQAYLWRDGAAIVTKGYPSSPDERVEPTDKVSVVQAFNRLYILREASRGAQQAATITRSGTVATVTCTAHGFVTGDVVHISGGVQSAYNGEKIITRTGANTFTYSVSGSPATPATGTIRANKGYGVITTNASGITVSSTTATVNVTGHGYTAGMRVRIEGSTVSAFNGHEYDILGGADAPTGDTFKITVPSGTANAAVAGIQVRRVKPPIYWDGGTGNFVRSPAGVPSGFNASYKSMRSVGWASYINNRLVIPDGRDQVMISDVLDPDVYDPFFQSFRAGAGGSDRIMAVHPWVDGTFLVFCRNSIWLATVGQIPSTDGTDFAINTAVSKLELLTNEIGCSARNTICTAGNFVFFLSDAGIYRLDSRLDLKLRGDTRPLSDPISNLFADVVQSRVEDSAFAVWHDNRYIIALPISEDPLAGNELVLSWNSLSEQWEYRDLYPESSSVNQILVGIYNNTKRVFSIPRSGNLYLLEENESGEDDQPNGTDTNYIGGRIKTRRLNFQEMSSKRFIRSVADVVLPENSGVDTYVNIYDRDNLHYGEVDENGNGPDPIGSITNSGAEEDYHLKSPIRFKAHAAELVFETTSGRPQIRSAAIEASPKSLPATLTRNES